MIFFQKIDYVSAGLRRLVIRDMCKKTFAHILSHWDRRRGGRGPCHNFCLTSENLSKCLKKVFTIFYIFKIANRDLKSRVNCSFRLKKIQTNLLGQQKNWPFGHVRKGSVSNDVLHLAFGHLMKTYLLGKIRVIVFRGELTYNYILDGKFDCQSINVTIWSSCV